MQNQALRGLSAYVSSIFLCLTMQYRKQVVFGIQKGTAVTSIDESYLIGTVTEFLSRIKTDNLLSEMDAKHHKIQFCMFVYPNNSQYTEVVCPMEYLELRY